MECVRPVARFVVLLAALQVVMAAYTFLLFEQASARSQAFEFRPVLQEQLDLDRFQPVLEMMVVGCG